MFSSEMEKAHHDRIKFCADIPALLLKNLWSLWKSKIYSAGTILTKPGQNVYFGYFVHTGVVCQYSLDQQGNKNVDNFIIGPKFLAPSLKHYFNNKPSTTFYLASADIEVREVSTSKLFKYADENPLAYKFLLYSAARNYRERELSQLNFKLNNAKERYKIFKSEYPELIDQIPLTQIASYLHIQPGSLSRIRRSKNDLA